MELTRPPLKNPPTDLVPHICRIFVKQRSIYSQLLFTCSQQHSVSTRSSSFTWFELDLVVPSGSDREPRAEKISNRLIQPSIRQANEGPYSEITWLSTGDFIEALTRFKSSLYPTTLLPSWRSAESHLRDPVWQARPMILENNSIKDMCINGR